MQFQKICLPIALAIVLSGCEDGNDGAAGAAGTAGATGATGTAGLTSLLTQTSLEPGNSSCPAGGIMIQSGLDADADGTLASAEITSTEFVCSPNTDRNFNRIATYAVCHQIEANCDTDTETVAEISAVSEDGLTVIYTDSPGNQIGFVDITDPTTPTGLGLLGVGGEPTSVAVAGDFVLVGSNTSTDFINTSGSLEVINIATQTVVRSINLGGQPDSVAVSPDGAFAAVIIENERDEDLGNGAPPQLPAGFLVVVNLTGVPAAWTTTNVVMTGISTLFPSDPEPEYVDINEENIAVVALQENNHIMLVDMATATVVNDFSAGTVDLVNVDATEEDAALISLTESLNMVPREPDGVSWLNNNLFVTADEGDLDGGSRGFTVFNRTGDVVLMSESSLDHLAVSLGHYPDARSGNKGSEPENVEVGTYGNDTFLFVNLERSSLTVVYNVNDPVNPVYMQTLPTAAGPEGAIAIPDRNLLVVSSEEDNRGDKLRGGLNIYQLSTAEASYPTLRSANDSNQTPIPWGAMSGLAADIAVDGLLYAVEDSFYQQNRIFTIDITRTPAMLTAATKIVDTNDILAAITTVTLADNTVDDDDASRIDVFDEADLALLINADKTINIDPEGISMASDGGFWVASEGSGTVGDAGRPVNSLNMLLKTTNAGVIESVVTLPDAVNDTQLRFGFEGVAEYEDAVYVAFQRVWNGEAGARIGRYEPATQAWTFFFYPLETPASQNGGWVGLSDITSLGNGEFMVVERDNQGGPDAAIKRLYRIDLSGLNDGDTVTKTLIRDLTADFAATGGLTPEKVEGAAVTIGGDVWVVNDNDGVDDNSGETQLINLGDIF